MRFEGVPIEGGRATGIVHLRGGARARSAAPTPSLGPPILCRTRLSAGSVPSHPGGWAGAILGNAEVTRGPTPFRFPVVGGLDPDLFRTGEPVELDGDHGRVDLGTVEEVRVVTSFLERPDGTILLLRRSDKVGSFQGRWAAVSGFLEDPDPEQQARREIREETGIGSADLGRVVLGRRVYARDGDRVFTVHPFRFRVGHVDVRLDWEHTEAEWVRPTEIAARSTVPKLLDAWRAVRDDRPIQRSQTPKSRR